jgi:predicted ferric reductase
MSMHGDWTKALHDVVKVPTTRPVFIAGPYASPFATALNYDNLILVASGIGITPALSIMRNPKGTKRVNLIW